MYHLLPELSDQYNILLSVAMLPENIQRTYDHICLFIYFILYVFNVQPTKKGLLRMTLAVRDRARIFQNVYAKKCARHNRFCIISSLRELNLGKSTHFSHPFLEHMSAWDCRVHFEEKCLWVIGPIKQNFMGHLAKRNLAQVGIAQVEPRSSGNRSSGHRLSGNRASGNCSSGLYTYWVPTE